MANITQFFTDMEDLVVKQFFLDAANEILKTSGMKMILDWKPSVSKNENTSEIFPKSIKLKFEKEINSEDIADHVIGKRKRKLLQ